MSEPHDVLGRALAARGARTWLRGHGVDVSGRDAARAVARAARRLAALDLCEGEIVAIRAEPTPSDLLALLALWQRRLVAFVLPEREPAARLAELVRGAGCRLLLARRPLGADAAELAPAALLGERAAPGAGLPDRPPAVLPGAGTVLCTSGSTGAPKLVVHPLGAHVASARGALDALGLGDGGLWLLNLPLHHVGGLAPLFRALLAGAAIALPDGSASAAVARHRPTHVSVVATQLRRWLDDAATAAALARCELVLAGGSAIPPSLRQRALDAGLRLAVSYGSTETASLVTIERDPEQLTRGASSGRPLPGRRVSLSAAGEILVGGDTLLAGYLARGRVVDPRDGAGRFATGDLGAIDAGGRLLVRRRRDRMLVSGGENVHPEEIEAALLALDAVREAVVVPVAHAEYGERPVAFVRFRPGRTRTARTLERHLRARLPGFKIPDRFYALPDGEPADRDRLRQRAEDPGAGGGLVPL